MAIGPVECLEFNKENFSLLITGNPQLALILLKLFCKRIYDQKRRLRILVIKDFAARIADVFLMYDEMNPVSNPMEHQRKFNITVQDISHWSGLTPETTRDEINKYVEKRKVEIHDNYMIVTNIQDMKRIVDSKISTNFFCGRKPNDLETSLLKKVLLLLSVFIWLFNLSISSEISFFFVSISYKTSNISRCSFEASTSS